MKYSPEVFVSVCVVIVAGSITEYPAVFIGAGPCDVS